jgi:GNAT superfamily N-acetyltransferase
MNIRQFTLSDSEETSLVIRKALVEVNSKDYPETVIRNLCQKFAPENLKTLAQTRDIFVATEHGRILGTVSLEQNTIYTVFVHPEYHGQGVGTRLMAHIEGVAQQQGHITVKLFASTTARRFYEKLGYKAVQEIHNEKTGTCIEMTKVL